MRELKRLLVEAVLFLAILASACEPEPSATISGELETWHAVAISLDGPQSSEAAEPNPFTDFRLNVTFEGPGGTYAVPGYYAADGHAGESSANSGPVWRAHFSPNAEGEWRYRVSFRTGPHIAVDSDPTAGEPVVGDGITGTFVVGPTDADGRDFRSKGWLEYVGARYLKFVGSGEWFLKTGTDSPENFLGYEDFDGTSDRPEGGSRVSDDTPVAQEFLHTFRPHVSDWREGDPTWRGDRGKGIVGALNYLSSKGVNSVYFLTMNVDGDGDDTWPWADPEVHDRFDTSKLDQWNIVFDHMQELGILMHVITQETENDVLLDGGELGPERKLYYRELVARFAHHPAIVWNLGEENTNTSTQVKAFAGYLREVDPYAHPIAIHSHPDRKEAVYEPLLGFEDIQVASLQNRPGNSHEEVKTWLDRSEGSGHPWVIFQDEQGPHQVGVKPDADDYWHDAIRDEFLWGSLFGGAAGVEWYFGYEFPQNDLSLEDFRSRDHMWDLTRIAIEFMHEHLPFNEMRSFDELTVSPDDYVFAKPGEIYGIYLPEGGSTALDLGESTGTFDVRWFNPRTGGLLEPGTIATATGPGSHSLGDPPTEEQKDWVVLVTKSP